MRKVISVLFIAAFVLGFVALVSGCSSDDVPPAPPKAPSVTEVMKDKCQGAAEVWFEVRGLDADWNSTPHGGAPVTRPEVDRVYPGSEGWRVFFGSLHSDNNAGTLYVMACVINANTLELGRVEVAEAP